PYTTLFRSERTLRPAPARQALRRAQSGAGTVPRAERSRSGCGAAAGGLRLPGRTAAPEARRRAAGADPFAAAAALAPLPAPAAGLHHAAVRSTGASGQPGGGGRHASGGPTAA